MSLVVVRVAGARADWWLEKLQSLLPEMAVRSWEDPGDRSEVDYAVVWQPPPGELKKFPNLKAIVSMGAGLDHVLPDPEPPRHLPILRTAGPDLRPTIREYFLMPGLRFHRRLPAVVGAGRPRQGSKPTHPNPTAP